MPLLFLAFFVLAVLAAILLTPLTLVQRYRVGTARRPARGWLATVNAVAFGLSTVLFLLAAAVTSIWLPVAFGYAVAGLTAGCALGLLGLAATRWDVGPISLHYTPNRWLVLTVMLVVTTRLLYGFWRGWQAWRAGLEDTSWLVEAGAAGSLAAGAVVLGYYVVYWTGVRRVIRRHRRPPS